MPTDAAPAAPLPTDADEAALDRAAVLALVAVVLLALLALWQGVLPLSAGGFWADLAFGRWVVEHGRLPAAEPFTAFGDPEAAYRPSRWLAQVGLYALYHAGEALAGGDALRRAEGGVEAVLAGQLLVLLAAGVALFVALWRRGGSPLLACVGVLLLQVFWLFALDRQGAAVVGVFCFAVLLAVLARPVPSAASVLAAPLLLALWANCHESWPAGLVLLAAWALGRLVEAGGSVRQPGVLRLLVMAGLAVAAVAVLTPQGVGVFRGAVLPDAAAVRARPAAWQPLPFFYYPAADARAALALEGGLYWLSLAVLLLSQLASRRRLTPAELTVAIVFAGWPLLHQHALPWWWSLLPWLAVPLWAGLADPAVPTRPPTASVLVGVVAVLLAALGPGLGGWLVRGQPRPIARLVPPATPWMLGLELTALADAGPLGVPDLRAQLEAGYPGGRFAGRVFACDATADYLLWSLRGDGLLCYGRPQLFPPRHWQQCRDVAAAAPGWSDTLDRLGVNLVVLDGAAALADGLRRDPRWRVVLDGRRPASFGDHAAPLLIAVRKEGGSHAQ